MFPARGASDILQHGLGTDVLVHLKPNTPPSRDDVLHCNTTGQYATLDLFLFVIAPRGHSNPSSSSFNARCQNTISFKSRGVQAFEGDVKSHRGRLGMPHALTGSVTLSIIELSFISHVCNVLKSARLVRARRDQSPGSRTAGTAHRSTGHPAHSFAREEAVVQPEMYIVSIFMQARQRQGSLTLCTLSFYRKKFSFLVCFREGFKSGGMVWGLVHLHLQWTLLVIHLHTRHLPRLISAACYGYDISSEGGGHN